MSDVKNAFDSWLAHVSNGDVEIAAAHLKDMFRGSPPADSIIWDLLEETGDFYYTSETFLKAARHCLGKANPGVKHG